MAVRRAIGLLTALVMLHLTFVGADFWCAKHGDRAPAGHQAMSGPHAAAAVASDVASAPTDQPCETPTQPECCRAMTSCAINAALRGDTCVHEPPLIRHVIASALTRVPPSPITAPDPPPPKA